MPRFHSLMVDDVRQETADAVLIRFAIPAELEAAFAFRPGQHLGLRVELDGVDLRRTYSICSGPEDDGLCIVVKRVGGGRFSMFANDELSPGMAIDVMPPAGRFTPPIDPTEPRSYVAFAAGSGITPVLSILKTVLAETADSRFLLIYGNRTSGSVLFKDVLEDLKDRHLERFSLVHVLSRERSDPPLANGRLDRVKFEQVLGSIVRPDEIDQALLCGPGEMIDVGRTVLKAAGVPAERILSERFQPKRTGGGPDERPGRSNREGGASAEHGAGTVEVEVVLDGARHGFRMARDGTAIVDAALDQGLELPYSCKGGMCCTCRAMLREGEVEMATNYSLEPWEVEAGYVLCCQARPLTDRLVLDFDQV